MIPYRGANEKRGRSLGVGVWCNPAMKLLSETNPFIRDPETRRRRIARSVYESSVFEGVRGLITPQPQTSDANPRSNAPTKKPVKSSQRIKCPSLTAAK